MEQTTEQLRAELLKAYNKAEDAAARLFSDMTDAFTKGLLPPELEASYKNWKEARVVKRIAQDKLQNRINKP